MSETKPRVYKGEGFSVSYDKDVCVHAGVCVKTLPKVFNPKNKPWVDTTGATKDEIREMIKNCPSGALKFIEGEGQ